MFELCSVHTDFFASHTFFRRECKRTKQPQTILSNTMSFAPQVDASSVELVTHVIWQPGKSFALIEFGSDGLADLAYQLCKMKPDAVRLAQQRLLVERPAGPKPNGSVSPGGSDLGLHVKVIN